MRIITMQRLTLDGAQVYADPDILYEYRDWWCVIETEEEEMVYDKAFHEPYNPENAKKSLIKGLYVDLWNDMVRHAGQDMDVSWGDDDMYGYIRPSEHAPEIKENFKDGDGDIWVRIQ